MNHIRTQIVRCTKGLQVVHKIPRCYYVCNQWQRINLLRKRVDLTKGAVNEGFFEEIPG